MDALSRVCWRSLSALAIVGATSPADAQGLSLAPVFSDHMVMQRGVLLPVWGHARPRDRLAIVLGRVATVVRADDRGNWHVTFPARSRGQRLTLSVSVGRDRMTVDDIAIGDVYLCSGQSNMEFAVEGSTGGAAAIATASDPNLRLLTVPPASAPGRRDDWATPARWRVAAPEVVARFSAACYFMGRDLRRDAGVPIGLIGAAVGGSAIQAWMSERAYRQSGGDMDRATLVSLSARDPSAAQMQWGTIWQSWWEGATALAFGRPWRADYGADRRWLPEETGKFWDAWRGTEVADGRGIMWYRASLQLTPAQAGQAATLELGRISELDQSWVNGTPAGSTYGVDAARVYPIAAGVLRPGDNSIAVAVDSRWVPGGFAPEGTRRLRLADGSVLPIEGWRYRVVPGWVGYMPRPPWNRLTGPSVLYNGMIEPLRRFPVRAIAWYQGEQNGDDAGDYLRLLTALMADWRAQIGESTAFLIVQLPNFGSRGIDYPNSNWPWLREAQRRAVAADPAARLIVTIDLGEAADIHPRDKLTVGLRLAGAARSLGRDSARARDIGVAVVGAGGEIELALTKDRAFATRGGVAPTPFVACRESTGMCREIAATLLGSTLRFAPLMADERFIRYCWADNPKCNIYDNQGNPLSPFEFTVDGIEGHQ